MTLGEGVPFLDFLDLWYKSRGTIGFMTQSITGIDWPFGGETGLWGEKTKLHEMKLFWQHQRFNKIWAEEWNARQGYRNVGTERS